MIRHLIIGTLVGWVMSWLMVVTNSPTPPLAVFAGYVVALMMFTARHPEIKED